MEKIAVTIEDTLKSIFESKTVNELCKFLDVPYLHTTAEISDTTIFVSNRIDKNRLNSVFARKLNRIFYQTCCKELYAAIKRPDLIHASSKGWNNMINDPLQGPLCILEEVYALREKLSAQLGVNLNGDLTLVMPTASYYSLKAKAWLSISALEMLHEKFPDLKVIHLPEFNYIPNFVAMLVYDDSDFGDAGYWAMKEQAAKWACVEIKERETVKYQVYIPEVKLIIAKPKQIAVLTTP